MARVSEARREPQQIDPVTAEVIEYQSAKAEIKRVEKRVKTLRDSLMEALTKAGYEDDQGHQWIDLDYEVAGVSGIQRQRRVSRGLDMESAEEILKGLDLWETCTKEVRVIDEDAVYNAMFDEKLTDADIDTIFPQSESYALVIKP